MCTASDGSSRGFITGVVVVRSALRRGEPVEAAGAEAGGSRAGGAGSGILVLVGLAEREADEPAYELG
jgi:hypothetical protein